MKMEQKVDKNSADIEKLQNQVEFLTQKSESQDTELQQHRENAERDRRELLLQIQVILLQYGVVTKSELLLEDTEKEDLRKINAALNEQNEALREQNTLLQKQLEAKNSDENETQ